VGLKPI